MSWTDERISELKTLWAEGLSCSRIAERLGGGVSRNAIIGKARRIGLPARSHASQYGQLPSHVSSPDELAARRAHNALRRLEREKALPMSEPTPVTLPDGSPITVETVRADQCRYIAAETNFVEAPMCGLSTKSGAPYCESHARKCYTPAMLGVEGE